MRIMNILILQPKIHQKIPKIIIFLLILINSVSSIVSSNDECDGEVMFSYRSFNKTSCEQNTGGLVCLGSVAQEDGYLNLTAAPQNGTKASLRSDLNAIGRVLHGTPVRIWPASFCTTFSIKVMPFLGADLAGDGMAFVMAQDDKPSPALSFGSNLGLQDQRISGGTKFQQLAIEFDTFKNEFDPDDNHIAIDTTSVANSLVAKSLNSTHIYLKSGKEIKVKIVYNGLDKHIRIYVGYAGNPLISFLNYSIKLSKTIPQSVYVGFTASTGTLAETHQILNWVFTSTSLPYSTVKDSNKKKAILEISVPILGLLVMFTACGFPIVRSHMVKKRENLRRMEDLERRSNSRAPRKFTYKQLAKATKNFSKDNLLGTGGFGSVYKGHITEPSQTIAVKRISDNSEQGEREYLAEICTIGRLRHKNLLQLQGWCHENENLLLVYDYMPNRSLHYVMGRSFLDFNTRYKILMGLASSLLYLHEECGDPVVHRDVKPSNIMLDSDFNPHLGDFGLARLLRNMGGATTMVAGTLGYMAPEVSYTGKATTASDVYSFGVVALEVICGRRFSNLLGENCLVDDVWEMHTKGSLLETVDPRLARNDLTEDQLQAITRLLSVALACLHLDSNLRPTIRKVVQILMNPEEPLIDLPNTRPSAVYVSIYGFSNPPSVTNSSHAMTSTVFPTQYHSYDSSPSFPDQTLATR